MGKALSIIIGLVLIALGIWGILGGWGPAVLVFVKGALVIMAIIIGLGIFVFGVSELRAGGEEPTLVETPPPPETPAPPNP